MWVAILRIRDTLKAVNAPINAKGLGIDEDMILSAFLNSKEIRPNRLTILDTASPDEIKDAALVTGIIS